MTLEQNVREVNSVLTAIKDKIIECGVEVENSTHARDYANKIEGVFDKGREFGVDEVNEQVDELNEDLETVIYGGDAGYKGYYDEFWDNYQQNGNRANYNGAFSGHGWTAKTFKPKYDIRPTNASSLFSLTYIEGDLVALLEELGITLDFSQCTIFNSLLQSARMSRVGIIDISKATNVQQFMGWNTYIKTIDKLIVSETTPFVSTSFQDARELTNITIEGTIGSNITLAQSTKLSHDSIVSIISALSPNKSGLTLTLSKTAVNNAFETSTSAADGSSSAEWLALVATKNNWTISLA